MIAPAHNANEVWKYWRNMRDRTYGPKTCDKKTMARFNIDKLQLAERNKAAERKKTGPPIITRDQLIADMDELHDMPRPVRVALVASYYGLSTASVNRRVGWNAALSGKSTGTVYEPTAEEIAAAAAEIRKGWSPLERIARARWAAPQRALLREDVVPGVL